jgi:hypothetical protein
VASGASTAKLEGKAVGHESLYQIVSWQGEETLTKKENEHEPKNESNEEINPEQRLSTPPPRVTSRIGRAFLVPRRTASVGVVEELLHTIEAMEQKE